MEANKAKPFLRWAGGKKWLLKSLQSLVDMKQYNSYHEPFLGGGAVFFEFHPSGKVYLSDSNEDLINSYICIKDSVENVWHFLKDYENIESSYYRIRAMEPTDRFERAARFIYLNQTSFNGLYRVNNSGKYNVPYGRRKNVSYNVENLHAVNNCLKHAQIYTGDFEKILRNVKKNDFIYLDPPYVVAKEGNGFIQYNKHLFSLEDQRRLSQCIDSIKENGAFYILSNACHDAIYEIFSKPGDSTIKLYRPSLIGGTNAFRGTAEEYLFTNIPNATDLLADSSHIHNN